MHQCRGVELDRPSWLAAWNRGRWRPLEIADASGADRPAPAYVDPADQTRSDAPAHVDASGVWHSSVAPRLLHITAHITTDVCILSRPECRVASTPNRPTQPRCAAVRNPPIPRNASAPAGLPAIGRPTAPELPNASAAESETLHRRSSQRRKGRAAGGGCALAPGLGRVSPVSSAIRPSSGPQDKAHTTEKRGLVPSSA